MWCGFERSSYELNEFSMEQQLKTELDLDDIVNIESMFIEFGREDGIKEGIKSGKLEGHILGCEKGYEISQEIGFYDGIAEMWLKIIVDKRWDITKHSINERIVKQLISLRELISLFPKENQQNIEFLELLNKIRSKHKVCISLLGTTKFQKFKRTTIDDKESENV
ncbi:8087_t:CDS:2 [Funneliformis geosporum]|uniref:19658_t:CDS:1 n=1 Tax=Funneliformis geosporum TaxID=1117311 RepID=A0A9W4STC1_9GLOM|nr:8087_t:CDS:2 [Funneliformis geosporum]CAI2180736.1 19658_t:CDS:2 [Funneliformis geosporum]